MSTEIGGVEAKLSIKIDEFDMRMGMTERLAKSKSNRRNCARRLTEGSSTIFSESGANPLHRHSFSAVRAEH